jgi:transcriptional regulator with XRE-family HTH domain
MSQNTYQDNSSTLCLDASEIRRIRESQQLTQLYVSKVVGVTTDTISRWENNRYPTIRRENALKLAEALEVPLEDILLKPVEASQDEPEIEKKSALPWLIAGSLAIVVLAILATLFSSSPPAPASVTADRILPDFAGPSSSIPVQIHLTHRSQRGGVIIREYFPKGWKIVQAHPPASSLDNVNGVARWIIKAGDDRERIVYLVQVDPAARVNSEGSFQGEIVGSNEGGKSAVPIQGESKINVAEVHWADANGDGQIDDAEMLEASFTIEDMSGVHIDWNDLEQLWNAGRYVWDKKAVKFLPQPAMR